MSSGGTGYACATREDCESTSPSWNKAVLILPALADVPLSEVSSRSLVVISSSAASGPLPVQKSGSASLDFALPYETAASESFVYTSLHVLARVNALSAFSAPSFPTMSA
ncbi:Uncharacterised protein [Mycobacteroides abscessus subsp. abscessus]|nr:Uncharacterised protein [Mycobacteroides abscessus subsp. abscessus]